MLDLDAIVAPGPGPTGRRWVDLVRAARDAGEPLALRIADRDGLVVRDPESFAQLLALVERLAAIEEVRDRLRERDEGQPGLSLEQARDHVRAKYGIPL